MEQQDGAGGHTLRTRPADTEALRRGLSAWQDKAAEMAPDLGASMHAVVDGVHRPVLETIFGCSPYLTHLALGNPAALVRTLTAGPDIALSEARPLPEAGLLDAGTLNSEQLAATLRKAKRHAALVVATADLARIWDVPEVSRALSQLADDTLDLAVRHLVRRAIQQGQIAPMEAAIASGVADQGGLIVLGMGKLGARELNYSSDIDLILLYDEERVRFTGRTDIAAFFARLARQLVQLMSDPTRDGYVFRTDLRLRPDPYSTPPAVSRAAAEGYYESMGQNWERAAMIKARPVAGDRPAGQDFLAHIQPFIWRRHLDYAALRDIQSIKRQIDAGQASRSGTEAALPHEVAAFGPDQLLGWNTKLGRGGIREIEFFVQTQQLIWGGRDKQLRAPGTCEMLDRLAAAGRITPDAARELASAYNLLRRIEHRLQMVEDRQTHSLPETRAGLDRAAAFIGVADGEELAGLLGPVRETVARHWQSLFAGEAPLGGSGSLVFTGQESDPDTLKTLSRLGFRDPETVARTLRGWHHGGTRATRSTRARELLTELTPQLLGALAATLDPDAAFAHFAEFLRGLPAGIQLFSLLVAHRDLLQLVAMITGDAPRLARQLAREPILIDAITTPGFLEELPGSAAQRRILEEAIGREDQLQVALERTRRTVGDARFRIGVQMLHRDLSVEAAGRAFADLAAAAIHVLLPHVWNDFARIHGRIAGAELVVVAMGRLGSREMTVTSDLDLLFVYDGPQEGASDGGRPLPLVTYMARLCQRLISVLRAPGAEGNLYEVDMRLRPSGNAGPIASSLEAFRRYHAGQAWTWERMALTRSRIVAGDGRLAVQVSRLIRSVLTRPMDPDHLLVDVADMRQRIRTARPPRSTWDVRDRVGGLIDLEFMAQYLALRHGLGRPAAPLPAVFARFAGAGVLGQERAAKLADCARFWQRIQGLLRLTLGDSAPEKLPAAVLALLWRATAEKEPIPDRLMEAEALHQEIERRAAEIAAWYEELIEKPALATQARRGIPSEQGVPAP